MASSDLYEMRFEWPHSEPNNVFVTGTFDHWTRSVKLTKTDTGFVGSARVPWAEKVLYKFVVDGVWICQAGQPTETDHGGFVNNVYLSPPKPVVAALNSGATHDSAIPVEYPKPIEAPAPEPVVGAKQEPIVESKLSSSESPAGPRVPIMIVPVNSVEHNTIVSSAVNPPAPDFVLPPPPRAQSAISSAATEKKSLDSIAPEQLHEVATAPEEPIISAAPEIPLEEQKLEDISRIPVDSNTSTAEPRAKAEEPVKQEAEVPIVPEPKLIPEPAKVATPLPAVVESKPTPASLPTPPATPSSAKDFPRSQSPGSSPSSSRFGTATSRKKRQSIFGKLKQIFHHDKDKEKENVKK